MKQDKIQPCLMCGEGVCHDNQLSFFRITISQMVIDIGAMKRQTGLEMMIGNPTIAKVMGPDEDIAIELEQIDGLVCLECAMRCQVAEVFESQP